MLPTGRRVDRGMEGGRDGGIEGWRGEGEGEERPRRIPGLSSAQPPEGGLRATAPSSAETFFRPLLSLPKRWGWGRVG